MSREGAAICGSFSIAPAHSKEHLRRSHAKQALINELPCGKLVHLAWCSHFSKFVPKFHEVIFSVVGDVPVDKQRDAYGGDFINLQIG